MSFVVNSRRQSVPTLSSRHVLRVCTPNLRQDTRETVPNDWRHHTDHRLTSPVMRGNSECSYREAFRKPAELLGPDVGAQFIQLLLDVPRHFTTEQRRRAGNHSYVCRDTQPACLNQVSEQSNIKQDGSGVSSHLCFLWSSPKAGRWGCWATAERWGAWETTASLYCLCYSWPWWTDDSDDMLNLRTHTHGQLGKYSL